MISVVKREIKYCMLFLGVLGGVKLSEDTFHRYMHNDCRCSVIRLNIHVMNNTGCLKLLIIGKKNTLS